jgi:hypothetical protein
LRWASSTYSATGRIVSTGVEEHLVAKGDRSGLIEPALSRRAPHPPKSATLGQFV